MPLPKLTSAGDRILFYRTFDYERIDNMTVDDFSILQTMDYDALTLMSDVTRKIIFIYDVEKLSLTFLLKMLEFVGKLSSRCDFSVSTLSPFFFRETDTHSI